MAEVLLVQPPLPKTLADYIEAVFCPPLGIGYLASNLLLNNVNTQVVDMAVGKTEEAEFKSEVSRHQPKIVGITASTITYKNALKIAKAAKELNSEIYTILGGPHVTFTAEETLANPQVDIVVRREGEVTMLELVHRLLRGDRKLQDVQGITYRKDSEVVNNPDRPLTQNLDSLPFPARHMFPMRLYKIPGTLVTSRGCPYRCIFCSAGAMSGGRYRVRSPGYVVAEMTHLIRRFGIDYFFIADDTFTVFRERTGEICRRIREMDAKVGWSCEARVNTVSREVIREMARSGCVCIQYGVESGSQRILNHIRKGITVEQVKRAVEWSVEAGVSTFCNFMMPFPEDTLETLKETEKLMVELKKMGAHLVLSLTTPFPGTYLRTHAEELGISILSGDTDSYDFITPLFTTRHLSLDQIEQMFNDLSSLCDQTITDIFPARLT